jgi:hypothetical protein
MSCSRTCTSPSASPRPSATPPGARQADHGMTPPIDRETLETYFGPDELITCPEAVVATIQHGPSARFLRDVGLPSRPNPWFDLVDGSSEGIRTLGACYDDIRERWANLPEDAGSRLLLGTVPYDDIALDGVTGVVQCLPGDTCDGCPLNKDLSSFAVLSPPAGEGASELRLRVGTGAPRPRGSGPPTDRADAGDRSGGPGGERIALARHPGVSPIPRSTTRRSHP